jgi:hypothetical protein
MINQIESHGISKDTVFIAIRVSKKPGFQKAVNRFRNYLKTEMKVKNGLPKGVIGKSKDSPATGIQTISGKGITVSIIHSEHYVHIITAMNKDRRPEFVEILKFFQNTKNLSASRFSKKIGRSKM